MMMKIVHKKKNDLANLLVFVRKLPVEVHRHIHYNDECPIIVEHQNVISEKFSNHWKGNKLTYSHLEFFFENEIL